MEVVLGRYVCTSLVFVFLCMVPHILAAYYTQNVWEVTKFRTVTRPPRLENYYRELRKQIEDPTERPIESRKLKERASIKKNICKNIFRSSYFRARGEHWINTDLSAVRKDLRSRNQPVFILLYKRSAHRRFGGFSDVYQYDNPYQLMRTAYMDDNGLPADENVILCLVRGDAQQDSFKEYFVSREYNVNLFEEAYPIVGRIIFSLNNNNELVAEAMAEESAISAEFLRRTRTVESFYIVKRKGKKATKTAAQDPICSLSDDNKVRLCASLFGASLFEKHGITFSPQPQNVHHECKKKDVRIHTPVFAPFIRIVGRMVLNPHRVYQEWVIGCKASPNRGEPTIFYVSRGHIHNTIFVYTMTRDRQKLSVYGYFNNVSVVGEVVSPKPLDDETAPKLVTFESPPNDAKRE